MQTQWLSFLQTQSLTEQLPKSPHSGVAALQHLTVLNVSGADSISFLQGQTSCDIQQLEINKPQFGAYCNAKGRTISSFIIIKLDESNFQIILPQDLISQVQKKLQMYILRSDVQLSDQSEHLVVLGIYNNALPKQENLYPYPQNPQHGLFIADSEKSTTVWQQLIEQKAAALSLNAWQLFEIQNLIPWLNRETTEQFVPQMLNLQNLNAISFEKGCYTGQEVVARTHYLGKNKRTLSLAHSDTLSEISLTCDIIDADNPENRIGTVISMAYTQKSSQFLVVLKEMENTEICLQLNNAEQSRITLDTPPL